MARVKTYLNVEVVGSFFMTSTILVNRPLFPLHINCLQQKPFMQLQPSFFIPYPYPKLDFFEVLV